MANIDIQPPRIGGASENPQVCNHPDCNAAASHRAPKGRDALNEHYWFCLDHVREYNRKWNYCAGMSDSQVEREIRNDTVWRRPTWPLGSRGPGARNFQDAWFRDDLGIFEAAASADASSGGPEPRNTPSSVYAAMRIIGLDGPVSLTELKSRYKDLVKKLHPDANGGDKVAEEKLKDINQAYATLKDFIAA